MGLKAFLADVFLGRSRAADLETDPFLKPWKRSFHSGGVLGGNPAPDMREALQAANKRTLGNLKEMRALHVNTEGDPALLAALADKTRPGVLVPGERFRSPYLAGFKRDEDGWAAWPEYPGYFIREAPGGYDYRTPEGAVRDGFDTVAEAAAGVRRDYASRKAARHGRTASEDIDAPKTRNPASAESVRHHVERVMTAPYDGHRHHEAKASALGAPWPKTPPVAPHDEHKAYPGKSAAYSTQVGGNHYAKLAVQPFEFSFANGWDGGAHSILKYVSRFEDKGGKEDLRKALHIAELRREAVVNVGLGAPAVTIPTPWHEPIPMERYCALNDYHGHQKHALLSLELWVMNPTISKHYADLRHHVYQLFELPFK